MARNTLSETLTAAVNNFERRTTVLAQQAQTAATTLKSQELSISNFKGIAQNGKQCRERHCVITV